MNLRIPGPTPCPPEVLAASAKQMINHRGPEFAEMARRIDAGLKQVYATRNNVLVLTASGTGAMESAVVNTLSPGAKVLAVSIGVFGDRFASIASAYGAEVTRLKYEQGAAADPQEVAKALGEDADYKALLITHNETSTAVTNPVAEIARAIRRSGDERLILVDAISSVSALPLPVDELDLDVVLSASQKGWMAPPGLVMASVSERAWRAWEQAKTPRFYFDYGRARDSAASGQTPWTPAVSVYFALDAALQMMLAEGMPAIYARHERMGAYTRRRLEEIGLELFADPEHASNTVTAVRVPEGMDGSAITRTLGEKHAVVIAGGQGALTGKILRVGHMGYVTEADIDGAIEALRAVLTSGAVASKS